MNVNSLFCAKAFPKKPGVRICNTWSRQTQKSTKRLLHNCIKNDKIFRAELFIMGAETGGFLTPVVTAACMPVSPFSVTRSQNERDAMVDIKQPAASSANVKVYQCAVHQGLIECVPACLIN